MNQRWPYWVIAGQVVIIFALVGYGFWRESFPGLMWTLRSGNSRQRVQAAGELARMGPGAREALPALQEALAGQDLAADNAIVYAIARVGGVPALAEALQSPEPLVRADVLLALASVPRTPATDGLRLQMLAGALRDSSPSVRRTAAVGLGEMGAAATPALPALSGLLYDSDGYVRVAAVEALARLRSLEDLAKAVSSSDSTVRRTALSSLPSFGPEAIPVLTAALENPDPADVIEAADALGYMRPPATSAVAALARALGRPERQVQMRVLADLERIGGPEAEAAIQQASNDPDAYLRYAALAALQRMRRQHAP